MSEAEVAVSVASDLFGDFKKRATELSDGIQYEEKTFLDFCSESDVTQIINQFAYPTNGSTSYVVLKEEDSPVNINAATFNDYYKCTMAPGIRTVYDDKNCVVQFRVDWRFGSSFNSHMQQYVKTGGYTFKQALAKKLNEFSKRMFTPEMIDVETQRPPLDGPGSWKKFFKDTPENMKIFVGKTLIASNNDIDEIVRTYNVKKREGVTDINRETDFYVGTSILKFTPQPKLVSDFPIVVLSIVEDGSSDGKPDVRATGNWPRCSWLETPMMQACYEFLHTEYLNRTGISYGTWMAEALYRTFSGMCFLHNKTIKVALFSGRRTGGALFHLLQVWLWNKFSTSVASGGNNLGTSSFWALQTLKKLSIETRISPTGTHAHELSMTLATLYPQLDDHETGFVGTQLLGHILYSLISGGNGKVPLLSDTVGTANFLKTACALNLPDFLKGDGESNCLTRFSAARQDSGELEHYKLLMMVYSALSGRTTCPMLMASEIDDRDLDFIKAILLGFQLAGVGGALGDSEKIDALKVFGKEFKCRIEGHDGMKQEELDKALAALPEKDLHFAASMAVKIVCVFVDGDDGVEARYTLKTGDAEGKLTIDPAAPTRGDLEKQGGEFQTFHREALENCLKIAPQKLKDQFEGINAYIAALEKALKSGDPAAGAEAPLASSLQDDYNSMRALDLQSLPKFDQAAISAKQTAFTELLEKFRAALSSGGVVASSSSGKSGGRRTRRRARKVTKKYVRKNIRKSKNKKSRRSYRRKSKK